MHPFAALQGILPQHALSRFLGAFAASRSKLVKRPLIDAFKAVYRIDMAEFQGDRADDFASFNDFFTRSLLPGTRPLPDDPALIVSPADGTISQAGAIRDGQLMQAKGREYPLAQLVGDDALAARLAGGSFVTVYLAPHNYHRVHAPCAARLLGTTEIPGRLFSVNSVTDRHVSRLFLRNERLVMHLSASFGECALVMVGAMIVASIRVVWPGPVSPYRKRTSRAPQGVSFERGAEVGAFLLGSTVIALLPPGVELVPGVTAGAEVRLGCPIAAPRAE